MGGRGGRNKKIKGEEKEGRENGKGRRMGGQKEEKRIKGDKTISVASKCS